MRSYQQDHCNSGSTIERGAIITDVIAPFSYLKFSNWALEATLETAMLSSLYGLTILQSSFL